MNLGIIPARGGSVRIPRKNARLFAGRPLVAWTIVEAGRSTLLDRVVVSTEDDEIAMIAQEYDAQVIRRPLHLASNDASVYDVIRHVLAHMDWPVENVILLHPTSPLRLAEDVDGTIERAQYTDDGIAVSACSCDTMPNGAVYVAPSSAFADPEFNWDRSGYARYLMPVERSADINTPEEFEAAERLAR